MNVLAQLDAARASTTPRIVRTDPDPSDTDPSGPLCGPNCTPAGSCSPSDGCNPDDACSPDVNCKPSK